MNVDRSRENGVAFVTVLHMVIFVSLAGHVLSSIKFLGVLLLQSISL